MPNPETWPETRPEIRVIPAEDAERYVATDHAVWFGETPAMSAEERLLGLPADPITRSSTTWVVVPPSDTKKGKVFDVRSGATGKGADGKPYAQW